MQFYEVGKFVFVLTLVPKKVIYYFLGYQTLFEENLDISNNNKKLPDFSYKCNNPVHMGEQDQGRKCSAWEDLNSPGPLVLVLWSGSFGSGPLVLVLWPWFFGPGPLFLVLWLTYIPNLGLLRCLELV